MSYIDKINSILDTVDVGSSNFIIDVSKRTILIKEEQWTPLPGPDVKMDSFCYQGIIKPNLSRTFNLETRRYEIRREPIIRSAQRMLLRDAEVLFTLCSPAKEPKRTKLYKSFLAITKENIDNTDFANSLFDICEYHWNVTRTDSIICESNDVHRKNIFHLLTLMEKSYGKRKT